MFYFYAKIHSVLLDNSVGVHCKHHTGQDNPRTKLHPMRSIAEGNSNCRRRVTDRSKAGSGQVKHEDAVMPHWRKREQKRCQKERKKR